MVKNFLYAKIRKNPELQLKFGTFLFRFMYNDYSVISACTGMTET